MSTSKFQLKEYVSSIALLLNAIMLLLAILQIRSSTHRDYVQFSYSSIQIKSANDNLFQTIQFLQENDFQISIGTPIDTAYVATIYNDYNLRREVHAMLGELDRLAMGVLSGGIDHDIAYELNSSTIINGYKTFKPYIMRIQKNYIDGIVWSQFRYLELKWSELRAAREIALRQNEGTEQMQVDMIKISSSFQKSYKDAMKRAGK